MEDGFFTASSRETWGTHQAGAESTMQKVDRDLPWLRGKCCMLAAYSRRLDFKVEVRTWLLRSMVRALGAGIRVVISGIWSSGKRV
jgi:hypothetical protein